MASPDLPDEAAITRTVNALQARNIHVIVTTTGAEACQAVLALLPDGAEICDNTSETLDAIGFTACVHGNPRYGNLHEAYEAESDPVRRNELRRRASIAEYVIGSVQAVAETGEIFISSSSGSQLAPYVYAAKRVILVVGAQKIAPTFADAMQRVRGHTLLRHDQWLAGMGRAPTPIGKLGIIEHENQAGRITVVLVRASLGW